VELRHFGFAQTAGDLVVWLPEAKVLWTGNTLQAPPPTLPWLLEGRHRDTMTTLRRVRDFLPDEATVIPGHGAPTGPQAIDHHLRYLHALEERVAVLIEQGMDLDQVKRNAGMPAFDAYSLYPWVHFEVNVPAVYRALK